MKTQKNFEAAVNWEWVHASHTADDGKVKSTGNELWFGRIEEHARRNGWTGKITPRGMARIINRNLW